MLQDNQSVSSWLLVLQFSHLCMYWCDCFGGLTDLQLCGDPKQRVGYMDSLLYSCLASACTGVIALEGLLTYTLTYLEVKD